MGKTEEWIAVRIGGKAIRLEFTSAFRKSLRREPSRLQYTLITDTMRLGLWKRKTAQLRKEMNLNDKDNLWDHQSSIANAYESVAEAMSAHELRKQQDLFFSQSQAIVREQSQFVGKQAEESSTKLGIDTATGKPLLPSGKEEA